MRGRDVLRILCATATILGVASARSTNAAPVRWDFEGFVRHIADLNGAPVEVPELTSVGIVPGAPFAATIILESTTPDFDPASDFGRYLDSVLAMTFSAGSYSFSSAPSSAGSQLALNVTLQAMLVLVPPSSGGCCILTNPSPGLEVFAEPGTFPSDAMPIVPPPLEDLDPYGPGGGAGFGTSFGLFGLDGDQLVQVRSEITSWVLVPEPSLAPLVVAALASLLWVRRLAARR